MSENNDEIPSTQKSLHSSHDPGWNDPPSWAYTPAVKTTGPEAQPKRLLNKRVAYPLSSKPGESNLSSTPINESSLVNLPPPPNSIKLTSAPHKPMLMPTALQSNSSVSDVDCDNKEILPTVMGNLRSVLAKLESTKKEEIEKRLERMETMWNADGLNETVHKNLIELSSDLEKGDFEAADKLHISLMMNHTSMCSSWIPGIRQLIAEVKNAQT
ncbi:hypothetical protein TKK_0009258 [Trichogramma kaykai]|uniref:SRA1/Sec31 domain-containing protein n=1 Tax=Trichogramma kaykai TaxID=54128 RepID=A0ABD2X2P0_9HYME